MLNIFTFNMHPFVKILYFVLILILMSFLSNQLLCVLFVLVSTFVVTLELKNFLHVIKRMRLLFLSILVIYAFATPGQYVPHVPVNIAPTIEGVQQGLLQVMKLLIALGALNLLYSNSSKAQLILGLYTLFKPLKYLGLNIERFTVRLFLTLEYVEDFSSQNQQEFSFNRFDAIHLTTENIPADRTIVFLTQPFGNLDKIMMTVFIGIVLGLLVWKLSIPGFGS